MPKNQHDVRRDYAGLNANIIRFTCYSKGCDGATLVQQPWMRGEKIWDEKLEEFLREHPCVDVKDEGAR